MDDLTDTQKKNAFIRATTSMCDADIRWKERSATGLTDEKLSKALRYELGIAGGSSSFRNTPNVAYEGSGLKIWAGVKTVNPYMQNPIFEGQSTISMARIVFDIADPNNKQMVLF